jgi:hypothetical protein
VFMMQAVWIMTGEAVRDERGGVGMEYSVGRMGNVVDSIQLVLLYRIGSEGQWISLYIVMESSPVIIVRTS